MTQALERVARAAARSVVPDAGPSGGGAAHGIAAAWNPDLHPRDREGKFRDKWGIAGLSKRAKDLLNRTLRSFEPRLFRSNDDINNYLGGISAKNKRGYNDKQLAAIDSFRTRGGFKKIQDALVKGEDDLPEVRQLDSAMRPLPDDMILTQQLRPESFGLTAQNIDEIEEWTGKLVTSEGFSPMNAGDPAGRAPGRITLSLVTPAGTPAIVPGGTGVAGREVILDRDQPWRITRMTRDGNGGWYVYGVTMPKSGNAEPSRRLGAPLPAREQAPAVDATPDELVRRGLARDLQDREAKPPSVRSKMAPPVKALPAAPQKATPPPVTKATPAPRAEAPEANAPEPDVTPEMPGEGAPETSATPETPETPETPAAPEVAPKKAAAATPLEERMARRAQVRDEIAERRQLVVRKGITGRVATEVSSLTGNNAEGSTIAQHVRAHALSDDMLEIRDERERNAMIEELNGVADLFENGHLAEGRARVQRLVNAQGVRVNGAPKQEVDFDPNIHEAPPGVDIPDGTRVQVTRPGFTSIMPDGTEVFGDKARVVRARSNQERIQSAREAMGRSLGVPTPSRREERNNPNVDLLDRQDMASAHSHRGRALLQDAQQELRDGTPPNVVAENLRQSIDDDLRHGEPFSDDDLIDPGRLERSEEDLREIKADEANALDRVVDRMEERIRGRETGGGDRTNAPEATPEPAAPEPTATRPSRVTPTDAEKKAAGFPDPQAGIDEDTWRDMSYDARLRAIVAARGNRPGAETEVAPTTRVSATRAMRRAVGEPGAPEAPKAKTAKKAAAPRRLTRASLKDGDIVVWEPPGEEPMVGRVVHEKAGTQNRVFVEWNGGRKERITGANAIPNVRRATPEEQDSFVPEPGTPEAAPVKKATPRAAKSKLLSPEQEQALVEERGRLSSRRVANRTAVRNGSEKAIADNAAIDRRLGQIRRQLKAHYDARDAEQRGDVEAPAAPKKAAKRAVSVKEAERQAATDAVAANEVDGDEYRRILEGLRSGELTPAQARREALAAEKAWFRRQTDAIDRREDPDLIDRYGVTATNYGRLANEITRAQGRADVYRRGDRYPFESVMRSPEPGNGAPRAAKKAVSTGEKPFNNDDLNKNLVTALRAEAKKRGIKVPPASRKPDLVALIDADNKKGRRGGAPSASAPVARKATKAVTPLQAPGRSARQVIEDSGLSLADSPGLRRLADDTDLTNPDSRAQLSDRLDSLARTNDMIGQAHIAGNQPGSSQYERGQRDLERARAFENAARAVRGEGTAPRPRKTAAKKVVKKAAKAAAPEAPPSGRLRRGEKANAGRIRQQMVAPDATPDSRFKALDDLGMNNTQARQLAKDLGIKGAGREKTPDIIKRILDRFDGDEADIRETRAVDKATRASVARTHASYASSLDDNTLENGSERAVRHLIQSKGFDVPDDVRKDLLDNIGDRKKLKQIRDKFVRDSGLTPIETDRVDVGFNPELHRAAGRERLKAGEPVTVVRRGYRWTDPDDNESTLLDRATVIRAEKPKPEPKGATTRKRTQQELADLGYRVADAETQDDAESLLADLDASQVAKVGNELGVTFPAGMGRDERVAHLLRSLSNIGGGKFRYNERKGGSSAPRKATSATAQMERAVDREVKPATPTKVTAVDLRRQNALEAARRHEITGSESQPSRDIIRRLEAGDMTPAAARRRALDAEKHWRQRAVEARGFGRATPAERRRIENEHNATADKYRDLAQAIQDSQTTERVAEARKRLAPAVRAAGKAAPSIATGGKEGFRRGEAKHLDVDTIASGLGERRNFETQTGNYLDEVQERLDRGESPASVARDLDTDATTAENHIVLQYGDWDGQRSGRFIPNEDPEVRADNEERKRLYDEGKVRVTNLRTLAQRLRETKRPRAARTTGPVGTGGSDPDAALNKMLKRDLMALAQREGVPLPDKQTVPNLREAIRAHRNDREGEIPAVDLTPAQVSELRLQYEAAQRRRTEAFERDGQEGWNRESPEVDRLGEQLAAVDNGERERREALKADAPSAGSATADAEVDRVARRIENSGLTGGVHMIPEWVNGLSTPERRRLAARLGMDLGDDVNDVDLGDVITDVLMGRRKWPTTRPRGARPKA